MLNIINCNKPKAQIVKEDPNFNVKKIGIHGTYKLTHMEWSVASVLARTQREWVTCTWLGRVQLARQPLTHVGAMPLLLEVALDWPTLLTITMQLRYMTVADLT